MTAASARQSGVGVIRWEEPPTEHGNTKPKPPSKYQPIADALREHPGEWALILTGNPPGTCASLANRIRTGARPFAPAGAFDAKVIGPASGAASKVYARYLGEESR